MRGVLTAIMLCALFVVACDDEGKPGSSTPDARTITERLQAAGVPIGEIITYTEVTDPNKLLGRPNGYLSKTAFRDTRLGDASREGGSVEVFADEAGATARREQMQRMGQSSPLLVEYDYQRGPVLVRLVRDLTPEQAQDYERALKGVSFE